MSILIAICRINFYANFKFVKRCQHTKPKLAVATDRFPVFGNVQNFPHRIALKDNVANYSFANIFLSSKDLAAQITHKLNGKTNERVLFLCPNDVSYLVTLWGIWMSGQIAVPLSPLHPKSLILYYANDCNANLIISTTHYAELLQSVANVTNKKLHVLDDQLKLQTSERELRSLNDVEIANTELSLYEPKDALILYTSGTTGSPKGVVLTHRNLNFQMNTLIEAWKWTQNDVMLHVLPLHHVHGIVNALLCPLHIGAKTVMLSKFSPNLVWSFLLGVNTNVKQGDGRVSVFMGVPTIYTKLIDEYERVFGKDAKMVDYIKNTLKNKIRLMISGSAPLPITVFDKWLAISGHRLLERYGMTEIGMCFSNSYKPDEREPGYVGLPLPGVCVKIIDETNKTLLEASSNQNGDLSLKKIDSSPIIGELYVKGHGVFKEYYNRPEATQESFTENGWFQTGDICGYSSIKRLFKILGRKNADIIKSGGFKVSTLEIETCLMSNSKIKDCVVVGLPDREWGEKVAAILVMKNSESMKLDEVQDWVKSKLPKYSIPKVIKIVDTIPKNVMGKVNKKELIKTVFSNNN